MYYINTVEGFAYNHSYFKILENQYKSENNIVYIFFLQRLYTDLSVLFLILQVNLKHYDDKGAVYV